MHDESLKRREGGSKYFDGAVGAGLVLVLLPCATLVFGMGTFRKYPTVGYPVLAIFGIMILLGTLALISTLFARLKLSAANEALALPPGSIRAAIALSLIVLFALLAVMLFQSLCGGDPIEFKGISRAAKEQLVADTSLSGVQVSPVACPALASVDAASAAVRSDPSASGASAAGISAVGVGSASEKQDACAPGVPFKFDVRVGRAPSAPAVDFAKQLLTLIGTLMTSVVSFYFAAKSTEAAVTKALGGAANIAGAAKSKSDAPADSGDDHGSVVSPTADNDLPQAEGGVAASDDSTQ